MKKSLLALAVLGAFAGVASAQSSVTLSGTVDLGGRYVKNDGQDRRVSLENSSLNASQLVFSGKEDLGGGLYAGFVLNAQLGPDTGNAGGGGTQLFNRRSTVSLWGNFGEIRLGRDYTPSFWNNAIYDAFGLLGVGDSSRVLQMPTASFARANNSVGYFLPSNIGGIYGQVMAAASEGATAAPSTAPNSANAGRYVGGRLGFAAGPFDISVAFAEQRLDATVGQPQQKTANIGGSYNLGVVKLMGYYDRDSLSYVGVDQKEDRFSLGASVPVGQGLINVGYDRSKMTDNSLVRTFNTNTISEFAVGYVYNLSKRTAVYSTVARLSNGAASSRSVDGGYGNSSGPAPVAGGKSTGFEFGLRHFF